MRLKLAAVFLMAWALPYWLFPTLYTVHEYYRYESSVFLILAAAACLSWLPWWAGTLLAMLLVVSQMLTFQSVYASLLNVDNGVAQFGNFLEANTKPDDVLVIFGNEWNPQLCYAAKRKCVMETTLQNLNDVIRRGGDIDDGRSATPTEGAGTRPAGLSAGRHPYRVVWDTANGRVSIPVGAIIRCPCPKWDGNPQYEALFKPWGLTGGTCRVAFLDKPPHVSAR